MTNQTRLAIIRIAPIVGILLGALLVVEFKI